LIAELDIRLNKKLSKLNCDPFVERKQLPTQKFNYE